jgi:hypothetical protein
VAFSLDRPSVRVILAALLIATWMLLLFTGKAFGGGVHALFVAALVVFPWRAALS